VQISYSVRNTNGVSD